ncbi:MAG TPA: ABC transporter ATP-binding protein [Candidatus Omnitrophica bacterium]|nr:ABC transporter ATP-binding protein [Candidatus Omnitrophota bacterium]
MSFAVDVRHLSKTFVSGGQGRQRVQALRDVSLQIPEGEIFGILGPNGAGKTTFLNILSTLLLPDAGTVTILGIPSTPQNSRRLRSFLNMSSGYPNFPWCLSVEENLRFYGRLYGLPSSVLEQRIARLMKALELQRFAKVPFDELSSGTKQKLALAKAMINEPKIIFLDEPTLGLDPDGASRILDLITGLSRERGLTVLLSSHMLHQVQQMCHRVGIIVKGKMIAQGQVDQLGSAVFKERQWNFLVEVEGRVDGLESDLRALHGVVGLEARNRGWFLRCTRDVRPEVLALVSRRGLALLQLRSEDTTLEDIYLKYFREA